MGWHGPVTEKEVTRNFEKWKAKKQWNQVAYYGIHKGSVHITLRRSDGMVKELHETEYPYYFDFPKKWLRDLDPPLNILAQKWRDKVAQ